MPGFLEVYGYYDNDLGSWAIDVSDDPHTDVQTLTSETAHRQRLISSLMSKFNGQNTLR